MLYVPTVEWGVEIKSPEPSGTLVDGVMAVVKEVWARIYLLDISNELGWHQTKAMLQYPIKFIEHWADIFKTRQVMQYGGCVPVGYLRHSGIRVNCLRRFV